MVQAGLNDESIAYLCHVVKTQKSLISLDISWNQLMPQQMKPLLEILQKNRRLLNINLSWNNIMRVPENLQPIAIGEGEETKVLEIE